MKREYLKQIIAEVIKATLKEFDSVLQTDPNLTTTATQNVPQPMDPVEKMRQQLKAKKAQQAQVRKIDKTIKLTGDQEKTREKQWKLTKRNLEKQKNDLKRPSITSTAI